MRWLGRIACARGRAGEVQPSVRRVLFSAFDRDGFGCSDCILRLLSGTSKTIMLHVVVPSNNGVVTFAFGVEAAIIARCDLAELLIEP